VPLATLISQILDPAQRKEALSTLLRHREFYDDLAPTMWFSTGVVAALLQEVISMYPYLAASTPPANVSSDNVCNALALFQCFATDEQTRTPFLHAQIPMYLYPFLSTQQKSKAYEYLRLTSLGVIGSLVKSDELEVVKFLLHTEIIPLCLRIMENGLELSRTVATFIVQKIIVSDLGIQYVCATPERFFAVSRVLSTILRSTPPPTARLLRHVVRCYLRLADHEKAKVALREVLPDQLRNGTFKDQFQEDATMEGWLQQLLKAVDSVRGGVCVWGELCCITMRHHVVGCASCVLFIVPPQPMLEGATGMPTNP
jgi:CCR4-NOT transcription complex subunit 9